MSAARSFTALTAGIAYAVSALPAVALAAWLSPLVPTSGRLFGVITFALAAGWFGASYGARYITGHPGASRTPWWIACYAALVTVFVWGYGYAWLLEGQVTRISILAPLVGLIRGGHFTAALLLSAAPLLAPAWWLVNRLLLRYADRIFVSAL